MKAAIIGFGYWGKILYKYLSNSMIFELVKICSPELDKEGIFTNNIEDILNDISLEAVFVCTPTDTHFQVCSQLLSADKHVFCEKPTVKTYQEFLKVLDIAATHKKILYTDYIYMVSPGIRAIQKLIPDIGEINYIHCSITQFGQFYPNDDVYEIIGVHMLSAVLFLTGCGIAHVSYQDLVERKNCECGIINLKLLNGCDVSIYCSLLTPNKERSICLYGEHGTIRFDMRNSPTVRLVTYKDSGQHDILVDKSWDFDEANSLNLSIQSFKECIDSMNFSQNKNIAGEILQLFEKRKR